MEMFLVGNSALRRDRFGSFLYTVIRKEKIYTKLFKLNYNSGIV